MSRSFREVLSSALRAAAFVSALATGPIVAAQDVGFEGPSYTGANSFPSGTKPESKLWFNDGSWWACLWSTALQSYSIHRLDTGTEVWTDTGVRVDGRPISRSDCLWNGTKLYVGSHRWNPGGGNAGHPLVVYRFSYDPVAEQYALDPGFPVQIADSSAETMVFDQDSTGTLWAVWMRDLRLRVTHTLGDDRTWTAPTIHPENTNAVTIDDVGSVAHFGGDKIGVLWSDQSTFTYWFSYHVDGDPDSAWSAAVPLLAGAGDDHINLKAAADGRLFAVLKTSTNEIHLAVRATSGTWTTHLISDAAAGWTRGICALDETAQEVHVFATSPVVAGTIYEKVSPMGAIAFPGGIGTPVIHDVESPQHNDSTTSKQQMSGATGLVVAACHQPTERYWHHHDDLGGPVAGAPTAVAAADPRSGFAPLAVQFTDTSTGAPASWFWTFGDGTNSTQQHPLHVYTAPGTYDVTLDVSNALGDDTFEVLDWITVDPAPLALTLGALEDTQLNEASPDNNYGALTDMRVRNSTTDFRSLVKFLVPASGNDVVSARLRLFANDGGPDAGTVYAIDASWQEPFVTWNTAPAIGGTALGSLGSVANNAWVELDVSSAVTTSGVVAFGIANNDSNSIFYSTREGAHPPELVLTLAQAPPIASFTADTTSGTIPLAVQFTDTSADDPTSWLWSFGDGGTSSAQHPSHVYTLAGTYTVSLTATNAGGSDVETAVGYIHALPPAPVASFTSDVTSGVVPLSVQFFDTSGPSPTAWSWDFGDGASSTAQDPLHVYTVPGVYTVSLTASNAGGSDVETVEDYVVVYSGAPIASFEVSHRRGPAPFSVVFTDTSAFAPTSWLWSFGDGTFSTAHNPKHVFEEIGTYVVTLTATNSIGSDSVQLVIRAGRPTLAPHAPPHSD